MRRNSTFRHLTHYYKLLAGYFSFFFLVLTAVISSPAYGINLTNVKPLFSIFHNFSQPSDVAVSGDGHIYIVDGVNNRIKVFNREGKFAFSFGSKGALNGQLTFPLGIDIGDSGRVYVADSGNHRVQIFSRKGEYIAKINIDSAMQAADPTDVAVNESIQRLYVADNDNHRVLMYDLEKVELLKSLGTPGAEEREFRYPFLMALDRDGYLYISDVVNTRVQVFNSEGLFVTVIGGWGVEKGKFFRPKGVAIDSNNRVYVSDGYMGVIQVFRSDGAFHSAIGDPERGAVKKFIKPMGLFIDKSNRLYVVEMFAERVSVYEIQGDTE